jgi:hypothetical protein
MSGSLRMEAMIKIESLSLSLKVSDLRISLRNCLDNRVVIRIFVCEDRVFLFVMLMFDLDLCLIVGVL